MFKDENGVYHNYCEKGLNAIAFLVNTENEDNKKAFEIAVDEFLKLEDMISGYEKLIKQQRDENWQLMQFIAKQNKEIREKKEKENAK